MERSTKPHSRWQKNVFYMELLYNNKHFSHSKWIHCIRFCFVCLVFQNQHALLQQKKKKRERKLCTTKLFFCFLENSLSAAPFAFHKIKSLLFSDIAFLCERVFFFFIFRVRFSLSFTFLCLFCVSRFCFFVVV